MRVIQGFVMTYFRKFWRLFMVTGLRRRRVTIACVLLYENDSHKRDLNIALFWIAKGEHASGSGKVTLK